MIDDASPGNRVQRHWPVGSCATCVVRDVGPGWAVLERPPSAGRDLVLGAAAERVVGVVSAGDLERVVLLRAAVGPTPTH